jgi:hypothetical protein
MAKKATRQPRRRRITGCSAISRPNADPTKRTPTRVSWCIVSRTATSPPSQAWLFAVLTMSNPARASASAARGGAIKTVAESGIAEPSGTIGLSRLPKVMSARRSVSTSGRNGYNVSPPSSRSLAVRRPKLMSPTAYSRSVSLEGGACSRAASRTHTVIGFLHRRAF